MALKVSLRSNNFIKLFFLFCLKLLVAFSFLKVVFYFFNYSIIFNDNADCLSAFCKLKMWMVSLAYDIFIVLLINIPFVFLLQFCILYSNKLARFVLLPCFIVLNFVALTLNAVDIFYFQFHYQRANADLLYVLDHPFSEFFQLPVSVITGCLLAIAVSIYFLSKMHGHFYTKIKPYTTLKFFKIHSICVACCIAALVWQSTRVNRYLAPFYALNIISSKQLVIAENSLFSFIYSLEKIHETMAAKHYFPATVSDSAIQLKKNVSTYNTNNKQKNIVLFIMESIPEDFFESGGKYKVAMPFFDSILKESTFFSNAFSFGVYSNIGITSILAATPTLEDIPLYYSLHMNLPFTKVGQVLHNQGYSSFFCIGDDYNNFGFANCTKWVGIDKYYCKDDILTNDKPFYKTMMGLHDEYVLDFMKEKMKIQSNPFFAINYNISTHFPHDLPPTFKRDFPDNYSRHMKCLSYYDSTLKVLFNDIKNETWYKNTVFIFCADHWTDPGDDQLKYNSVNTYRIPIIIFDPANPVGKKSDALVSQFDVLGTIISISGYRDTIISYGNNLLDSASLQNRRIITKSGTSLFQAIDSSFALGFNSDTNKPEYLFCYKTDHDLSQNLLENEKFKSKKNELTNYIRAFLQKASLHYNGVCNN